MTLSDSKVRRLIQELGVSRALLYGIGYSLSHFTGSKHIYYYLFSAQPVPAQGLIDRAPSRSIRIATVPQQGYDQRWFPRPADVINTRYEQGAMCFVAFKNDEPVGCLWLVFQQYNEDEVACCFRPEPADSVAWDFDLYIAPEHRVSRLFVYLWDAAFQWLRQHGYSWTMSRIDAFNAASVRTHARLGAKTIGQGLFLVVGRLQLSAFSVKPFVHIHWRGARPPRVRLRVR